MDSSSSNAVYEAPAVLEFASVFLDFPRQEYSVEFADFVSDDPAEVSVYKGGLVFLGCIIAGFVFVWSFMLITLKCKGREVGCASGNAFTRTESRRLVDRHQHNQQGGSTDLEEFSSNSIEGPRNYRRDKQELEDQLSLGSSISSNSQAPTFEDEYDETDDLNDNASTESVHKPTSRELRTRSCFLLFGVVTMACVPLIIVFAFAPVKSAIDTSHVIAVQSTNVLDDVQASVDTISYSMDNAGSLIDALVSNSSDLCPQVNETDMETTLGLNFTATATQSLAEFYNLEEQIQQNISDVKDIVSYLSNGQRSITAVFVTTADYVWVVPGILLGLVAVTVVMLFGVALAWKRDSNLRFQRFLSYFILPMLIAFSLMCWVLAIISSVSTASLGDFCTTGGWPNETIGIILSDHGINENSTLFQFVNAYIDGCTGENPTSTLIELEANIQDALNYIWTFISSVDSIGRDHIIQQCGNGEIQNFLTGVRDLAKMLTTVRKALENATDSLDCEKVSAIYSEAVDHMVCTDVASASAWAFFLFIGIGVSTMVMISLRASWRHTIVEEKIYDESEEAENMVVDEHEEYLVYISKYKHEWEEYQGFDSSGAGSAPYISAPASSQCTSIQETPAVLSPSTNSGSIDEEDQSEAYRSVCDETEEGLEVMVDAFDPYLSTDTGSQSEFSEDISFLSLRDVMSTQESIKASFTSLLGVRSEDLDGVDTTPLPILEAEEAVSDMGHSASDSLPIEERQSVNAPRSRYTMLPSPQRQTLKRNPLYNGYLSPSKRLSGQDEPHIILKMLSSKTEVVDNRTYGNKEPLYMDSLFDGIEELREGPNGSDLSQDLQLNQLDRIDSDNYSAIQVYDPMNSTKRNPVDRIQRQEKVESGAMLLERSNPLKRKDFARFSSRKTEV